MFIKNSFRIIKASLFQFIGISVLISFLLFLLNLLFWISYNIKNFSEDIKHRLGIYLYIKEIPEQEHVVYSEVISLKEELESAWFNVEYYSKARALELIETRMPDVINFEKYWITNPLPPTLYATFNDKQQYEELINIIPKYEAIILNMDDINQWKSFSEQENRIKNIINFSNFVVLFSYFIILVLIIIIISFLLLVIKISFQNFYSQIEIEKLLWAYYYQIKLPFLINIAFILIFAFLLIIFYFSGFFNSVNEYIIKVFEINLMDYISKNSDYLLVSFVIEFVLILGLSLGISNILLSRLLRKV